MPVVDRLLSVLRGLFLLGTRWPLSPSFAKARAQASPATAFPNVRVFQRQRVGVFDTVTLTAKESTALTTWLTTNGFATPTNAAPVIAHYVQEGWVFVVARVARATNTTESTSLHPLSFPFKSRDPVYPLRLTGVDNGPCTVDLREPSLEDLSRLVKEIGPYYWQDWRRRPRTVQNPFTGEPLRMEKSPGNVWLQPSTNGLEMIWFDFEGAPGFTSEVFR